MKDPRGLVVVGEALGNTDIESSLSVRKTLFWTTSEVWLTPSLLIFATSAAFLINSTPARLVFRSLGLSLPRHYHPR